MTFASIFMAAALGSAFFGTAAITLAVVVIWDWFDPVDPPEEEQ